MRLKTNSDDQLPKARTRDLLMEEVAGELLIFDVSRNRAHCLNASAAAIWQHCNGARSPVELAEHLFPGVEPAEREQLVRVGLERLRRRHLLESSSADFTVNLSKRHMIKKLAMVAAAAGIAAPVVSSIVAPTPGYAVSCGTQGMPCMTDVNCCEGLACPLGICV